MGCRGSSCSTTSTSSSQPTEHLWDVVFYYIHILQNTYGMSWIVVFYYIHILQPTNKNSQALPKKLATYHTWPSQPAIDASDEVFFLRVLGQGVVTRTINLICHWTWVILHILYMLSMKFERLMFVPHITLAICEVIVRYLMVVLFSVYYVDILAFCCLFWGVNFFFLN